MFFGETVRRKTSPHGFLGGSVVAIFSGRGGLDLSPLQKACGGGNIRQGIRGQSRGAVFSFVKTSVQATPHLMWWGHPRGIQGTARVGWVRKRTWGNVPESQFKGADIHLHDLRSALGCLVCVPCLLQMVSAHWRASRQENAPVARGEGTPTNTFFPDRRKLDEVWFKPCPI